MDDCQFTSGLLALPTEARILCLYLIIDHSSLMDFGFLLNDFLKIIFLHGEIFEFP
jgi:hypothetical protein